MKASFLRKILPYQAVGAEVRKVFETVMKNDAIATTNNPMHFLSNIPLVRC